jgi:predicted DNA-binding protein
MFDDEEPPASMTLYSFRLPPALVEQLDELAERDHKRRADLVREALTRYVSERTEPITRDEAEHALDVLRQVVAERGLPKAVTEE